MRQKRCNSFFTFLYPGLPTGGPAPSKDAPHIAIPNDGSFLSICGQRYGGEQPSAVFYTPQPLRDLVHVLEEAADLFEDNQLKSRRQRAMPVTSDDETNWPTIRKEFDGLLSNHQQALKAYNNVMNKDTERAAEEAYAKLLDFVRGVSRS
jgi:hypothetical protein